MSHLNDISPLDDQIDQTIKHIKNIGEKLFENKLKYGTEFNDEQKQSLKNSMEKILQLKNQMKLQKIVSNLIENEIESLDLLGDDDNISQIDTMFNDKLEHAIKSRQFNVMDDDDYKNLLRLLDDNDGNNSQSNQENEDIEMMESETFTIPIDPICRTEIRIPVRNKQCGHLYDKENLMNLLGKHSSIKCPVTGCLNKNVTATSVEEDSRLRILIENAKQ